MIVVEWNYKKFKDFFVTIRKFFKIQSKEHNNDDTNAITNSDNTAQILIPTNPYGIGNGGNNRLDIQTQRQSTTTEKDGRNNSTAHNESISRICGAESRRSGAMGEGSQGIGRIHKQEIRLTKDELNNLRLFSQKVLIVNIKYCLY